MNWFTFTALVFVYPLWAALHEGTHALVAWHFGATIESFRPWPSRTLGRWTFGAVQWRGALSVHERGLVYFAPRMPAFLATVVLALASYGGWPDAMLVLLAGGLIDQIVNFLGISDESDLKEWCRSFSYSNPWYWRAIGLMTALMFGWAALASRFG